MNKKQYLILVLLCLTSVLSPAQNPYIKHLTTSDGLPSSVVYDIFQDSRKFIWFATDAGVAKYDGSHFNCYNKKNGLSGNEIIKIKEDRQGRIWFFNLNGSLNFFYKNKIYNESNTPFLNSLHSDDFFRNMFQDTDQTIFFFGNKAREIFALSPENTIKKYQLESNITCKSCSSRHERNSIRYISRALNGDLLMWLSGRLCRMKGIEVRPEHEINTMRIITCYEGRNHLVLVYAYRQSLEKKYPVYLYKFRDGDLIDSLTLPPGLRLSPSDVMEDNDGITWVSSYEKSVFCLKDGRLIRQFNISKTQAVMQDCENSIWITSMNDGVFKINRSLNQDLHFEKENFNNNGITGMCKSLDGGIWLTTGKDIFQFRQRLLLNMKFQNPGISYDMVKQLMNGILLAGEKDLTFYAFKDLHTDKVSGSVIAHKIFITPAEVYPKQFATGKTPDKFCAFKSNYVLFSSMDDPFNFTSEYFMKQRIYNVFYKSDDELLINAQKTYRLDKGRLTEDPDLSRFEHKIITSYVSVDKNTDLYTIDGDSIYIIQGHKIFNLTAAFPYPIDSKIRKLVYHEPSLYLATSSRIYRCENDFQTAGRKIIPLQQFDPVFNDISDILVLRDSLYVGSKDGLTIIPEKTLTDFTTTAPVPYIYSLKVNESDADLTRSVVSFSGHRRLQFEFSCINYSSQAVFYSYKLEGADTSWITGTVTNLIYEDLPVGNYVLYLKARKTTSAWSEPVLYTIHIKATIWQRTAFRIFLACLAVGLIVFMIIYRKNKQISRQILDHQLITLEQKALQAMMNPHFIFNALGSIQNYLLRNKPGEAGLYLSQFARLVRQNLNAINKATILVEEEADRLKNYLDLEKLRMQSRFSYEIDVDEELEESEVEIPSMIVQPFVENAIRHGISGIECDGLITVSFVAQSPGQVRITITDNGIGMEKSIANSVKDEKHISMGIEITQKRLFIMEKKYKAVSSVGFYENSPGQVNPGTKVIITLPVMKD